MRSDPHGWCRVDGRSRAGAILLLAGLVAACATSRVQGDAANGVAAAPPHAAAGSDRTQVRLGDQPVLAGSSAPTDELQPAMMDLRAREIGLSVRPIEDEDARRDLTVDDVRPPPVPRERLDAAKARDLATRRDGSWHH